ncbi:hypothetical protein QYF61_018183 [Mycteria americana]|uniref:Uncharacterized protein n=1 Tax=Mycteria americana TaxID=33587 RepID=A0AAN7MFP2_MYCAM|nr:hypothetical protein QYF61_018183 [Mycteria americana]
MEPRNRLLAISSILVLFFTGERSKGQSFDTFRETLATKLFLDERPRIEVWLFFTVLTEERCSSPLIIFMALLWTRSNRSMSFSYCGPQSWTQHSRAALNPFIPQPVLILVIALTRVQDLAHGLVELQEIHMGLLLKPVKVPLDGIPSLKHINCTTQLGVFCKLAEGALNPTVYAIDENIK